MSAVKQTLRIARTDIAIGGTHIKTKDIVILDLDAASLEYSEGQNECPGRALAETSPPEIRIVPLLRLSPPQRNANNSLRRRRALLQLDAWTDWSDRYCPMESLDDFVFVLNFVLKKMH